MLLASFTHPTMAQPLDEHTYYYPLMVHNWPAAGWAVGDNLDGYGSIIHTLDSGQTWTRQGTPAEIPNVPLIGLYAIDRQNAWVVGGLSAGTNPDGYGVILRTRDGGGTWQRQGSPAQVPDVALLGVYALDGDAAWVVGLNGVILHTSDGGLNWTRQGQATVPAVMLQGIYASDADHVWVAGDAEADTIGTVARTTDGGDTWVQVPYTLTRTPGETGLIMTHGVDEDTVWVVGPGQVSMTDDGGLTWVDQWNSDIGGFHVNGVFALNREWIWLARDYGQVYLSTNGGADFTMQPVPSRSEVMRISALDKDNAWAVTTDVFMPFGGEMLATIDGGQHWFTQTIPIDVGWSWVSFAP